MPKPLDALDYLAHPAKHPAPSICVLFGDEPLLKRYALSELKEHVLSGDDAEFSVTTLSGRDAQLRDVRDALATRALFGGGRHLVVVDEADEFVSRHRSELESYVAKPTGGSVLVLDVKLWPATTRLYKALAESGLQIECKFPAPAKLLKWLVSHAKKAHQAELEPAAAELLAETLEPELGLFDQELAKLAAMAVGQGPITTKMVKEAVAGWRVQTAWDMLDAALAGETATALLQLERLLLAGEAPIALMGQISSSLRRLAAATQLIEQGEARRRSVSLRQALEQAGAKPFLLGKLETQMRRLGRRRAAHLYRWLLDADLALKGTSSSPARARTVLEQLLVRISASTSAPGAKSPASR